MAVTQKERPTNRSRAEWMLQRLANDGLRLTGQRATVVQSISVKSGAFNPEALVDELRPGGIGRATVYRTLDLLERRGMLARIHLDGCHGFTVCDEGHHHHLVCRSCGKVAAIDADGIEDEIRALAEGLKFQVDTHTLEFAGLCENCKTKS
ncbi:MAG TPA: Fur family transcriptional regulator [Chloroflexota bacterium]|nr:Fur family transcriptional regulator [Chloroflexota bacterium]